MDQGALPEHPDDDKDPMSTSSRPAVASSRCRWLAIAAVGLVVACSDGGGRGGSPAAATAECPGEQEGARCIKACGLAVETTLTSGVGYQVRSETAGTQTIQHPEAAYTVATFLVSGLRVSFDIPRPLLSDLQAGEVELPLCVELGMGGAEEGHAQYLPSGKTFSTDDEVRGRLALTAYDAPSGILEGIFSFDAALETGGGVGAEDPAERWITHIEQGWFRAQPR